MKSMDVSIIISWIKESYEVIYKPENVDYSFCNIRIWANSDQSIRKDFLYLTDDMSAIDHHWAEQDPNMLVFCIKTNYDISMAGHNWDKHLLIIRTDDPVWKVLDTFQDTFDRYMAWYNTCIDMILENKNLPEFLNHATIYLDNPVAFFDPSGVLLHQTGTFHENIEGTLWDEVLHSGLAPTETVTPSEHFRIMQKTYDGDKLITSVFLQDPSHHAISIPLHVDGKLAGAFGMIDINAPFTSTQNAFLREVYQLTELALKRLVRSSRIQDEENYYVTRLLQGFPINEHATAQYLKSKNYNNSDMWYLYQFPVLNANYAQTRKASYINRINAVFPNAITLFFEDSLISICRKKDFDPEQKSSCKKLENILEKLSTKIRISSCFTHFTDLSIAYGQCKLMEKYLADDPHSLQHFDNCFESVLYGILSEKNSLKGFCHPTVLSMWESQSEHKHTLVRDLKYYLINGRNIAETSRCLNLHRNTFIYRLQKIEECFSFSLDHLSENMLIYLLLSCMICDTIKK